MVIVCCPCQFSFDAYQNSKRRQELRPRQRVDVVADVNSSQKTPPTPEMMSESQVFCPPHRYAIKKKYIIHVSKASEDGMLRRSENKKERGTERINLPHRGAGHGPPADIVHERMHGGALGVGVGEGRVVGQGAVEEDGAPAVALAHINDRLVEGGVGAVADELVEEGVAVAAVLGLVAAAGQFLDAAADDGLGLVLVGRLVEEGVGVVELVVLDAVAVPAAGPEVEGGSADEDKGRDEADRAAVAGAVGGHGTTSVVATAAESGLGTAAAD
ncbi:hypothetical protein BN1723_013178, partial [Verticillium longisporum]